MYIFPDKLGFLIVNQTIVIINEEFQLSKTSVD